MFTYSYPYRYPAFSPGYISWFCCLPPFFLSLRVPATQDCGMGQLKLWDNEVRPWSLGKLRVEVHHSSSAAFPALPLPLPAGPPGPMLLSKAFSTLSYPSFTLSQQRPPRVSCSASKNFPTTWLQTLTPHMHSASLVYRVTTPCLGNYAARDTQRWLLVL